MSHEANYVRSWVCPLILGLLAASPAFAEEPSVMVLEGTTAAPYDMATSRFSIQRARGTEPKGKNGPIPQSRMKGRPWKFSV